MSSQMGKLCSMILLQHFGENVQKIGNDLFAAVSKTLNGVVVGTKMSRREVIAGLTILVQYRLVVFKPGSNENICEYWLIHDRILLMLRYPRYVHQIQKEFGNTCALLVEELLKSGVEAASDAIVRAVVNSEYKDKSYLQEFRDSFAELVSRCYLIRSSIPSNEIDANCPVPVLQLHPGEAFSMPEITMTELTSLFDDNKSVAPDKDIFWVVNTDRFHQDFRDEIMTKSIERQIDTHASEGFQLILQIMYKKTDPWVMNSNPISLVEIRQLCEKTSNNFELVKQIDQYIRVIEHDATTFIKKIDESGGGLYVVTMKTAFEQLTWATIENIITQKFGSKAARIFRVVRLKKFIEQEDIQKEAMVPSKEAKLYTYKLLEENFLQIQTIKKAGGGGAGPAKVFFLFRVNQHQIVLMLVEIIYKAFYNAITRSMQDKETNKRLMEKSLRLDAIVEAMKERNESEDVIQEILETLTPPEKDILEKAKIRIKNLNSSEIGLDETLMIFQFYLFYQSPVNK